MSDTNENSIYLNIISILGSPSLHQLEVTNQGDIYQRTADGVRIIPSIDPIVLVDLKMLFIYDKGWYLKNSKDQDILLNNEVVIKNEPYRIKSKQIIEIKSHQFEITFSSDARTEEAGQQTLTELLSESTEPQEQKKEIEDPFGVISNSFSPAVQRHDVDLENMDILERLEQEYQEVIITPEKLNTSYDYMQMLSSIQEETPDPFEVGKNFADVPVHDVVLGQMTISDIEESLEGLNGDYLFTEDEPVDVLMLFASEQTITQRNMRPFPKMTQKDHSYNSLNSPLVLGDTYTIKTDTIKTEADILIKEEQS